MKYSKLIVCSLFLSLCVLAFSQETLSPRIEYASDSRVTIDFVICDDYDTGVAINVRSAYLNGADWTSISSKMTLSYIDPKTGRKGVLYPKELSGGNSLINMSFDTKYKILDFGQVPVNPTYVVTYDPLPYGVKKIDIEEQTGRRPWVWRGIEINPRIEYKAPWITTEKEGIDSLIKNTKSEFKGYYEQIDASDGQNYQLAFVQSNNKYYLVYIGGANLASNWKLGEVKAELRQSAVTSVFKATWYMLNKRQETNCIVTFEPGLMNVNLNGESIYYIKMSGNEDDLISNGLNPSEEWSGTGFALNKGYVVTNYHVVENANKIEIYGVKGGFTVPMKAEIVGVDKINDLALLKVNDDKFDGFGDIPFGFKMPMADVGENVFVLGYPLITTMGEEIKLTNGIISSRTGFEGDVSLYQISAPVQPGNSGGPLFDNDGNIIGVICAKHTGAENVSYAIKMSYLNNLVESFANSDIITSKNNIKELELKEQVKRIKPFVFMIKCSK